MNTAAWLAWLVATRNGTCFLDGDPAGGGGGGGGGGDDPAKTDPPKGGDDPAKEYKAPQTQEELDRIVQSRLSREREKYAGHDELKKKADEYDKAQEAQKTELQKASDKASAAETRAAEAELKAMKLEVAAEKGLNATQAKRLVGTTKEELEADADELLDSFKTEDDGKGGKQVPTGRPKERLRGGGAPDEGTEEMDPRKLSAGLSRY